MKNYVHTLMIKGIPLLMKIFVKNIVARRRLLLGNLCKLQGFRHIDLNLYTIKFQVNKGSHERVN